MRSEKKQSHDHHSSLFVWTPVISDDSSKICANTSWLNYKPKFRDCIVCRLFLHLKIHVLSSFRFRNTYLLLIKIQFCEFIYKKCDWIFIFDKFYKSPKSHLFEIISDDCSKISRWDVAAKRRGIRWSINQKNAILKWIKKKTIAFILLNTGNV